MGNELTPEQLYLSKYATFCTGFIQQGAVTEMIIVNVIAKHFCGDYIGRRFEFVGVMHEHIQNFQTRLTIFSYLISEHHPKINSEYPRLIDTIRELMDIRNYFAHRVLINDHPENTFVLRKPLKLKTIKGGKYNSMFDDYKITINECDKHYRKFGEVLRVLKKLEEQ